MDERNDTRAVVRGPVRPVAQLDHWAGEHAVRGRTVRHRLDARRRLPADAAESALPQLDERERSCEPVRISRAGLYSRV